MHRPPRPRALALAVVALTLVGGGTIAWPAGAAHSTLASLGPSATRLSEPVDFVLYINITDDGVELPTEIDAGHYLVILGNATGQRVGATLLRLPESAPVAALPASDAATADGLPAWLAQAPAIGGPGPTEPGRSSGVILDLAPGSYAILLDYVSEYAVLADPAATGRNRAFVLHAVAGEDHASGDGGSAEPDESFELEEPEPSATETAPTVEAEPPPPSPRPLPTPEPSPPPATATAVADASEIPVIMGEFFFVLPPRVEVGRQIWSIVNAGQQSHQLIVLSVPSGVTAAQVQAALFPPPDTQPVEGAPDPTTFAAVGGLGVISPGLSGLALLDLSVGTFAALSFVPDPATGIPDAANGMIATFDVESAA